MVAMGATGGGYGATDKPSPKCFLPKHKNTVISDDSKLNRMSKEKE